MHIQNKNYWKMFFSFFFSPSKNACMGRQIKISRQIERLINRRGPNEYNTTGCHFLHLGNGAGGVGKGSGCYFLHLGNGAGGVARGSGCHFLHLGNGDGGVGRGSG